MPRVVEAQCNDPVHNDTLMMRIRDALAAFSRCDVVLMAFMRRATRRMLRYDTKMSRDGEQSDLYVTRARADAVRRVTHCLQCAWQRYVIKHAVAMLKYRQCVMLVVICCGHRHSSTMPVSPDV